VRLAPNATISIGFQTSDVATYAKVLGVKGVAGGDTKAQVEAIASYINHHGGLAGHPIKVVYYEASTAQQLNDPATGAQAACAKWTQDAHVFAVVDAGIDQQLLACLARAHTPVVNSGVGWGLDGLPAYQYEYAKYPTMFNIAAMTGERYDRLSIQRVVARNFFQGWDTVNGRPGPAPMKLGLGVYDDGSGRADVAVKSAKANLARFGIKVTDVYVFSGDLAQREAAEQAAVVRFRADGITHVMGNVGLPFLATAKSQHYYPRYFYPIALAVIAASAPADELRGSMGESYLPTYDVSTDPGPPTAATNQCIKIMRAAGQPVSFGTDLGGMESECDGFFFLQAALKLGGNELSEAALIRGFNALGSRLESAVTWTTSFGPTLHASALALRDLAFQEGCSCYVYVSKRNYG
jgi:hypothetical protein